MRIVLSRKGFDSQYGKVASPILPNGTMVSVPIPSKSDPHQLGQLHVDGANLAQVIEDLTRGRIHAGTPVHLDPDIDLDMIRRLEGWRPAFGQLATAQAHLQKQGIGRGDLFLFFGWFRRAEQVAGRWRFVPLSPDIHAIFGWLQVGERICVGRDAEAVVRERPWLAGHPHVVGAARYASDNNVIYVASDELSLGGRSMGRPGAGPFRAFRDDLRLTAPDARGRSTWQLPAWFMPDAKRPALTYHRAHKRWQKHGSAVELNSVGKGQEFVLDTRHYPEAIQWLEDLFQAPP